MPRWAVVAIRQRRPVIVTCLASAGGGDVDRMDLLGHSTRVARCRGTFWDRNANAAISLRVRPYWLATFWAVSISEM